MRGIISALIIIIALFLSSCYSMMLLEESENIHNYLEEQKGKMTYDNALSMWGEPSNIVYGDNIFVASWSHNSVESEMVATGASAVARTGNRGWIMHLTFDKESKKMTFYSYYNW